MKNIKKLSLLVSVVLTLHILLLPLSFVLAEEENINEETTTDTSLSQTTTGDAVAAAETNTTVNLTETEVSGTISTNGCNVDGDINCSINQENTVVVETNTEATANSGQNTSEDVAGDSTIDTGNAISSSISQTEVNTNIIEASPSGETSDQNNNIFLVNTAEIDATNSAQSTSGRNEITDPEGDAIIETDTSIASVDQVNLVNANVIGSSVDYSVVGVTGEATGDINLNELWKKIDEKEIDQKSSEISADISISIVNEAELTTSASAQAVSGQNNTTRTQDESKISTGDSIANANIFNLVNINMLGSKLLISVINIYGNLTGDIIIPNKEKFLADNANYINLLLNAIIQYNFANVTSDVTASADSGNNLQSDQINQIIKSGEAYAQASSTNYLNLNLYGSDWYTVFLNNFGYWQGNVVSWDDPAAKTSSDDSASSYQVQSEKQQETESENTSSGNSEIYLNNLASINSYISASAISGQNQATGGDTSTITTGRSIAFANLFNFINSNFIGSRILLPIINIFGSWKGNLVFAYPILEVSLNANKQNVLFGDEITYTVNYKNTGYETATNAKININLPEEVNIISSDGLSYQNNGSNVEFKLGDVAPGVSASFTFIGRVNKSIAKKNKTNYIAWFINKFAKTVEAAEDNKSLTATAKISTSDSQADTSKNSSSFTVYLINVEETNTESFDTSHGVPKLLISSNNNVGEFVYPQDVVTFFVTVKNDGTGLAKNTIIYQQLVYQNQGILVNSFKLGDISLGASKEMSFGLQVPQQVAEGSYQSYFYAQAEGEDGSAIKSETTLSNFFVKLKYLNLIPVAKAEEKKENIGQILGEKTCQTKNNNDWYLYLLIVVLTLLYLVELFRRKKVEAKMQKILKRLEEKSKSTSS